MKIKSHYSIFASLALLLVGIALFRWLPNKEQTFDSQLTTANRTHSSKAKPNSLRDVARELETATKVERTELISERVKIARARQTELAEAAKKNPERVLRAMMGLDELAALPPEIRAESEKPFSAIGNIDLRWATSINPDGSLDCSNRNLAIVDGKPFEIAGASFMQARQPVTNIPLNGYLVGDVLVLEKSGVRQLSPAEAEIAGSFFPNSDNRTIDPVTGSAAAPTVAAVIGGKTFNFESPAIIDYVRETLENAENAIDPSKDRKVSHGLTWLPIAADSGSGSGIMVLDNSFQDDDLDVLFIRADFPDLTGEAVTKEVLENSLAAVNSRVQDFSYGNASITYTVTDTVYRLTTNSTTVATGTGEFGDSATIIAEARAAAQEDFTLTDYDVVAVFFPDLSGLPNSKITYGGLATIGGANHWINGVPAQNQVEIILHEFGHNYGLFHANYFNPTHDFNDPGDEGYFDPAGVSLEYGDIYDRMGEGDEDDGYFSPYATSRLEWMPSSKVIEPTSSGTFTIHRFDLPTATTEATLALRVPMGGELYNWVGLRELYDATKGQAYIVNEGIYIDRSNLIDATPGSMAAGAEDRSDATLPVLSNFYDSAAGVRFTTMSYDPTPGSESIDVKIEFDTRFELQSTNIIVEENAGNAVVVVNRCFNSTGASSVDYATTAGTATADTDYHTTSGTVSWVDGDSSPKAIYIPIRPDTLAEGNETFNMTLSAPTNGVLVPSKSVTTVRIIDAGNTLTNFAPGFFNTTVSAIAPLPDGKVVAGGNFTENLTGNIVRFNADGSEDSSFLKGTGFNGVVTDIARQTDGKLVVNGSFTEFNGSPCPKIARLNANGSLDTDFVTALGTGANNNIRALALLPDGNILLGGSFSEFNGTAAPGVARISPTGTLLTFAPPFTTSIIPQIYGIDVDPNGKIMIVGQFAFGTNGTFKFSIARLNIDGTLDESFNPGFGAHQVDLTDPENPVQLTNSAAFVTKIGSVPSNGTVKYMIYGFFTGYNGTSVPSTSTGLINTDGTWETSFTPGPINGQIYDIHSDQKGRLLIAGSFSTPGNRIAALQTNGAIDTTLNFGGGTTGSFVAAIATDSIGNIYLGGNFFNFGGADSRPIIKIYGGLDSYSLWKNSQFTAIQITAGKTDPEEDFDNDGILNVTEMALGTSPTTADSPNSFAIAAENLSLQSSASSEFLQATMLRSANNLGVWLVAQFSSDLTTWLPVNPFPGSNATYDVMESTSTRFTVKDKTPAGPGVKRFVRFRALVPN